MKIRNILIALVVIISVMLVIPTLEERTEFESSHNGYEAGLVFTNEMTKEELLKFKEKGITTLVFDEHLSEFDDEMLDVSKNLGFNAALRINVGDKKDEGFEKRLDTLVKENDIRYIILSENKDNKAFDAPLERVIDENDMTLVLSENTNQLSNKMPKGYERYIKASDGKIMRSYETLKNPLRTLNSQMMLSDAGELLYHHMINSLRDRNTEFIVLNLIDDLSGNRALAIDETIFAFEKFTQKAEALGYERGKEISLKGYEMPQRTVYMASVALLLCMALISLEILMKKRVAYVEWAFLGLSILAFCFVGILPDSLAVLIPSLFAPLSSCFAFSITIATAYYAKKKELSLISSSAMVFSSAIISLSLVAICLGAMLSGTDFYLNNLIFRGVKLSLIFPIAYAILWVWLYEGIKLDFSKKSIKAFFSKVKLFHIIIGAFILFALGIYVMRSGNAKISPLENTLRNFIADIFGTRPRTKEFLIGWPLLSLSVVMIKCSNKKIIRWAVCVGSSVLFASVTNTFCHVFTDFFTSIVRTVNGLLFALPIVALFVLTAKILKRNKKIVL